MYFPDIPNPELHACPLGRCLMYGVLSEDEALEVQKKLGKSSSRYIVQPHNNPLKVLKLPMLMFV